MAEPKNPFDFGTGSIDKDQWLRDIDNEQDAFISRYGNATNKHRTALLRQAFSDLRTRIANGDMLNRTADGNYQFGSALNREDKHMQEAYQRALGFMGGLARRQIQAPPSEPEKKAVGSLEERYIKSLNPSGKFNTEAYWKNLTDEERRTSLKNFLNKELKDADNYQDFGEFGDRDTYALRLQAVMNLLESGKANDWSLQQLGFTKNWLTQPTLEESEEKKSELEQVQADIAAAQEAQQVLQGRQFLAFNGNRGQQEFNFTTPQFDLNYQLQHLLTTPQEMGGGLGFAPSGPSSDVLRRAATSRYIGDMLKELDNYFKNFATAWKPLYNNGEDSQRRIGEYLSKLFSTYSKRTNTNETPVSDYAFDWKKYFTLIGQNQFLINGSIDNQTGRYAYYVPGEGIREDNILDNPNQFVAQKLGYTIPSLKEGGKVEFLQSGGGFNYDAWITSLETPKAKVINKPLQTTEPKLEGDMDAGDWATLLGTTAADIGSMLSANAVGAGTAVSAGLGVTSTLGNSINEFRHGNVGSGLANLGIGLTTDLIGLVPGLGAGAKGYKIGRTLTRFARPLMAAFTANNFKEAGDVLGKGLKNGFGSLTAQDWTVLSAALTSMISRGKSVHTRQKNVEFVSNATKHSSPTDAKGNITKHIINEEGLTKARKELLQQKIFGFNTSSNNYTEKLWKSIPEGGEISAPFYAKPFEWPSLNIGKKARQAQLTLYEEALKRLRQPNIPEKNYSSFEARLNGEASPLNIRGPLQPYPTGETYVTPKTKRKPLTDQQKAARKLRAADKKRKELALKELENLRRNQSFALAEEIPQAGTYANIQLRQQDITNLSSRYANEVELPLPLPRPEPGPRSNAFNLKYGKAIGKKGMGGILKALRNGGIIKAQEGLKTNGLTNKYNNISDWTKLNFGVAEKLYFPGFMKARYDNRGNVLYPHSSFSELEEGEHFGDQSTESAYKALQAYYLKDDGAHIFGDVLKAYDTWKSKNNGTVQDFINYYNGEVDWLRSLGLKKLYSEANSEGWKDYNQRFNNLYGNYSSYDPKLEDIIGESTWQRTPNTFKGITDLADLRLGVLGIGDGATLVAIDNLGHLITDNLINPKGDIKETKKENDKELVSVADSERPIGTLYNTNFKNPTDPTPFLIAGKTALGLMGNRNIYKNLLDEMPQAPLRDPIDRKLAIVGWLEQIKQGQNQLADLRNATWMQHGADQQTNLAGMHEVENKGRGIMDDKYMKDSERLFDTALKSWNIDNEDYLYNVKVGDDNRRAIADRARMMAQIRAAWRSGDNNILMGGLSDTGNWLLKKYQREQDIVNLAREQLLGTKELFMENYLKLKNPNYEALKAEYETTKDTNRKKLIATLILEMQIKALREAPSAWAQRIYRTFHTPGFGGGFKESLLAKDGTKLEIAKLKARGKDNDRYVSMMKDIRKSSYRRRRR